MNRRSTSLLVFGVAAAIAPAAMEASAQTSTQPSGALASKGRQQLSLTVASTGGYDIDAPRPAAATTFLPGADQAAGYSTMIESGADYLFKGRRLQVRANGGSAQRYLRPLDNVLPSSFGSVNHSGAFSVSGRWSRTSLSLNQTALYTSSPLYSFFTQSAAAMPDATATPGVPAPADDATPASPVYGMNTFKAFSYGSSMMLAHDVTRHTGVALTAEGQRQRTEAASGSQSLNMYGAGVHMMHRVGRNTTATARYLYRISDVEYIALAANRRLTEQGVELGLEQRQPLSASRRLTISALTGASTLLVPQLAPNTAGDRRYTQFWGQMALNYELSRRWRAAANYRQGIEYLTGLTEPVFARSASASTTGLITRRVDVAVTAGYTTGKSALSLNNSVFDTYTGDIRLRYSPTRTFATYVQYLYYFYDSRGSLPLVPGMPSTLDRKSIRGGLVVRLPAL